MLKPSVPRRWLFFAGASVWGYAAYRVLLLADSMVAASKQSFRDVLIPGLAGLILFFSFVFLRVSRKYIRRIACMKQERPCLFAFFGWKSYLLIVMMSCLGVLVARFHWIPVFMEAVFYFALGGSLLLSALMFVHAGFFHQEKMCR